MVYLPKKMVLSRCLLLSSVSKLAPKVTEYQDTGRLRQVLGSFTPDMTTKAMVSALINDATTFGADMTTEEEDDITVVVVKVL